MSVYLWLLPTVLAVVGLYLGTAKSERQELFLWFLGTWGTGLVFLFIGWMLGWWTP